MEESQGDRLLSMCIHYSLVFSPLFATRAGLGCANKYKQFQSLKSMLFIKWFTWIFAFNHRINLHIVAPYLANEKSTYFKTVIMNKVVDTINIVVPDSITVFIFYPVASAVALIPQLIFNLGNIVVTTIYYAFSDLDDYFEKRNYTLQPKLTSSREPETNYYKTFGTRHPSETKHKNNNS
jgi:hypothetical protein